MSIYPKCPNCNPPGVYSTAPSMANENAFARAAREFLELGEDDYYFNEYDSALDHHDGTSLSELARYFFKKGQESK